MQLALRAVRLLIGECTSGRDAKLLCELCPDEHLIRVRVVRPVAVHLPPRLHEFHARRVELVRREFERMLKPRTEERHALTVPEHHLRRQRWRKRNDVVRPENRLDIAEIRLVQILAVSALRRLYAVEILQNHRVARRHRDVRTECLKFLIHLFADVKHDVQHGSRKRDTEGDRQRNEDEPPALADERPFYHLPKHGLPPLMPSCHQRK